MSIKCNADNYVIKSENGKVLVYNELYECKSYLLLLCAWLDLFNQGSHSVPPIAISFDETDSDVLVDKKSNVIGTKNFDKFIPSKHYKKWKFTYSLVNTVFLTLNSVVWLVLLYIMRQKKNFILFAIFTMVLAFTLISLIRQMRTEKKIIEKYDLRGV